MRPALACQYFNSRPHGGRQNRESYEYYIEKISTHALTEGDTMATRTLKSLYNISTHALTEGD